ncbi:MAG: putative hemagglutinin [Bacteroidetes bacterium]|nr:putative hemagglutinin [Bacteroidota bacterium]
MTKKLQISLLAIFGLIMFAGISAMGQTVIFSENFDGTFLNQSIPSGWTNIDADGDSNIWYTAYGYSGNNPLGNNGSMGIITSRSWWANVVLTPDNWLITPQISLETNASLKYYVCSSPTYPAEHYGVYISTTGTNSSDFTLLFEETLTAANPNRTWLERNIDLSAYNNQQVYIAWRHFNCSDEQSLDLDDISVMSSSNTPSSVTTLDATNLQNRATTLNATITRGTDIISSQGFEWKAETDESLQSVDIANVIDDNFSLALTELSPYTIYKYKAYIVVDGNKLYGEEKSVQTLGLNMVTGNTEINIYPNPVSNDLNIECSEKIDSIEVYDSLGRRIIRQENSPKKTTIDVSNLNNGIYILKLITEKGIGEYKIVKG